MAHDFDKFPELTNGQMQIYYFQSPHKQIVGGSFGATVVKVTDGDTVSVSAPFRDFEFPIRIADIAAPELNEGGEESRDWMRDRIEGLEVEIQVDQDNRVGKYGRLIGKIFSFGMNVGEQSMIMGHSVPFDQKNRGIPDINISIKRAGI